MSEARTESSDSRRDSWFWTPSRLNSRPGLYAVTVARQLVYVGIAKNLQTR